jgi:thymidylate kinase
VLLDVPIGVAADRVARPLDMIEAAGDGFFRRVREGFLSLAERDASWTVVDGVGAIDDVARRILEIVTERLGAPAR